MAGLSNDSLIVPKTIKLFINGEFVRTESGRSFPCYFKNSKKVYAHLCLASRKDLRSAVTAAKEAQKSWALRSAYNRSQILYRMAEMTEGKKFELAEILENVLGLPVGQSQAQVASAIDAFIYYAGFCDKYQQVIGAVNPVSGPHHNFTTPEPMGVVGLILDPEESNLEKIVADICAITASGNSVVALLPNSYAPLLSVLAEVFATSDLPQGVVNLLSGHYEELAPHLASHMEIQALCSRTQNLQLNGELKTLCVDNMKRFVGPTHHTQTLENILDFVEYKTVWHPIGH